MLEPLTGVGTDMSVTRPRFPQSAEEGEGGPPPGPPAEFGLDNLGNEGESFSEQQFLSPNDSFSEKQAAKASSADGVESVSAALTLDQVNISGEIPEESGSGGAVIQAAPPPQGGTTGSPDSIGFDALTVSGLDVSDPSLALVKEDQITDGEYLTSGERRTALVSTSYAAENEIDVGGRVKVGGERFDVVGLSSASIGGESSDVYVNLAELQNLADREDEVNVLTVRAADASSVAAVSAAIENALRGSEVTTAQDLANQVSGSLVDAQDLSEKLGTALAVVALVGAIGIASLLTLSSVNKRTRELGTLKALGWSRALVVRQVAGESLAQGLLGGVAGVAIGLGGAALVGALGISLDATVEAAQGAFPGPPGAPGGPSGATEATEVLLGAPVDAAMVGLAVALAAGAGLIAGAVGAARAARLRPAEALRSVE